MTVCTKAKVRMARQSPVLSRSEFRLIHYH